MDLGQPGDTAVVCTTSGTTSRPKLAELSHTNLLAMAEHLTAIDPIAAKDRYVSFLPFAWIGEQMLAVACGLSRGLTLSFPEAVSYTHLDVYKRQVLDIVDIGLHFGGVTALKDVGFRVTQGHIHSVIGPNGAGKSSLLNCISGLYHPQEGSIHLHTASGAHELTAMQPHRIARLGVARSFQNIELFTHLTVLELSLIHI